MKIDNATDILKHLVTKTEKGNWKVGNRYMKNSVFDEGELYLLDSTWLESIYWNRDTRIATVYFQEFETNGKPPVVLFNVNGATIRRFREAQSPGRFYLKVFSIKYNSKYMTMSTEVLEQALEQLKDYLPNAFMEYLINSKTIRSVFKNPVLAASRYVGNIVRNTFQALGFPIVSATRRALNVNNIIGRVNTTLTTINIQNELQVPLLASIKVPVATPSFNLGLFLKGLNKLFLPISLLSFVVSLPISISNEVKNNLKLIGVAEARANAISATNRDFLRRTTELKTKLLVGSSFSNPHKKLKTFFIKPVKKYKDKIPLKTFENPLVKKVKETKRMIYDDNKSIVKVNSKTNQVKNFKNTNTKRLKTYKKIGSKY